AAPTPEMCWPRGGLAAGPGRRHRKSAISPSCRRLVQMASSFLRRGPHRTPPRCRDRVRPSGLGYRGRVPEARAAPQSWSRGLSQGREIALSVLRVLLPEPPHSHVDVGEIPSLSASMPDLTV